jgi:hypothetical protein
MKDEGKTRRKGDTEKGKTRRKGRHGDAGINSGSLFEPGKPRRAAVKFGEVGLFS